MKNQKWTLTENKCQSFQLDDYPNLIHIIKTGFPNKYILVREDLPEHMLGITDIDTKEFFENKYNIKLD